MSGEGRGRCFADLPPIEAAFLLALAHKLSQGRGKRKKIFTRVLVMKHFLHTPPVPGGKHLWLEGYVWVIDRDHSASKTLAAWSRACAVAPQPPWGRADRGSAGAATPGLTGIGPVISRNEEGGRCPFYPPNLLLRVH